MTEANPENSIPFREKMDSFLNRARTELASEKECFQEARAKFKAVMQFYQFVPKGATLDTADPKDFFLLWLTFCKDFKVTIKLKDLGLYSVYSRNPYSFLSRPLQL